MRKEKPKKLLPFGGAKLDASAAIRGLEMLMEDGGDPAIRGVASAALGVIRGLVDAGSTGGAPTRFNGHDIADLCVFMEQKVQAAWEGAVHDDHARKMREHSLMLGVLGALGHVPRAGKVGGLRGAHQPKNW